MIRRTVYIFLVISCICATPFVPCAAAEYGDASDRTTAGDFRDYQRRRDVERAKQRREDRREEEEAAEHRAEEKADEIRRNNKYRSDDENKGEQAVSDDDSKSFGKRKTLDDNYDGSQFNSPDFAGTDFSKSTFDDLDKEMRKFDDRSNSERNEGRGDQLFIVDEMDKPRRHLDKQREKARERFLDLSHRDDVMPGADWAPSKMDPESNGGFGTPDDNGSPVPYHLNGHPDLQRRPAWESSD